VLVLVIKQNIGRKDTTAREESQENEMENYSGLTVILPVIEPSSVH